MAPAEIWQGGALVNKLEGGNKPEGGNTHVGRLNGKIVVVKDSGSGIGCSLLPKMSYLGVGNSITLDGGEIVKSVK